MTRSFMRRLSSKSVVCEDDKFVILRSEPCGGRTLDLLRLYKTANGRAGMPAEHHHDIHHQGGRCVAGQRPGPFRALHLGAAACASVTAAAAAPISLQAALALAMEHNPGLRAAAQALAASEGH
jgi:hypothetical protein